MRVFPLLIVAASVGLGNLAAAIGIGFGGVTTRTRLRVALVFGLFETGMPIIGLVIGASVATSIGQLARWIGAALLIVLGGVTLLRALRQPGWSAAGAGVHPAHSMGLGKLIVTAFALSLDNLAAGFALGTLNISVGAAALVIGAVSVLMSLAGLELGGRVGAAAAAAASRSAGPSWSRSAWPWRPACSDRPGSATGQAQRPARLSRRGSLGWRALTGRAPAGPGPATALTRPG